MASGTRKRVLLLAGLATLAGAMGLVVLFLRANTLGVKLY